MDKVTTVTTQPSVTSQHLVTSLSSRSPITLVVSQSSVSSQSVVTSQPSKNSAIPEKDFLSLSFEELSQVEVRAQSASNNSIRIEAQKAGEVQSKPVDFLKMSFEQLSHLPVRFATLSAKEKEKEANDSKEVTSSAITLENLPIVLTKQSLVIKVPIKGEVRSVEKDLTSDTTTTTVGGETTTPPPTPIVSSIVPVPIFIPLVQFLAVSNTGSGDISIFLRNSDGTFTIEPSLAVSPLIGGAFGGTIGDLNGDGILDFVVCNFTPDLLNIFLGTGPATFGAPTAIPTGSTKPSVVVSADFNGDGILDLAATNANAGNISILLGIGDGTFGPPTVLPTGGTGGPNDIVVSDLNGDGFLDLAVLNGGDVSIFLGTGTGAFVFFTNFLTGGVGGTFSMVGGDFNKDGILDLAVAEITGSVSVLFGVGNGNFGSPVMYSFTSPLFVTTGDFNNDGNLDLAVGSVNLDSVYILLGSSSGTFVTSNTISGVIQPTAGAVGDFNRDGKLDLAIASSGTNELFIFYGNGNGTFNNGGSYPVGANPQYITVGILPAGVSGSPINLALMNSMMDAYGTMTLTIDNIPSGWMLNAGVNNFDGSWTVQTMKPELLTITTTPDFVGSKILTVDISWVLSDGSIVCSQIKDCVSAYAPGSAIFALPGDNLTGSTYADKFVIRKSESGIQDKIFNFDSEFDIINLIDFNEALQFSDLQIVNDLNGNAMVSIDSESHSIILNNVKAESLNASHFLFDDLSYTVNMSKIEIGVDSVMPYGGVLENNGIIEVNGRLVMHGDITGTGKIIIGHSGSVEIKGHIHQDIIFEAGGESIAFDHFDISLASLTRISLETILECYPALI